MLGLAHPGRKTSVATAALGALGTHTHHVGGAQREERGPALRRACVVGSPAPDVQRACRLVDGEHACVYACSVGNDMAVPALCGLFLFRHVL